MSPGYVMAHLVLQRRMTFPASFREQRKTDSLGGINDTKLLQLKKLLILHITAQCSMIPCLHMTPTYFTCSETFPKEYLSISCSPLKGCWIIAGHELEVSQCHAGVRCKHLTELYIWKKGLEGTELSLLN